MNKIENILTLTPEDIVTWFDNAGLLEREEFLSRIRLRKVMPCFYLVSGFTSSSECDNELNQIVDDMLNKLYTNSQYSFLLENISNHGHYDI